MNQFVQLLFEPIEKGQSLILLLEAKAGRRALPKFLMANFSLFKDQLPREPENYSLYYIDPPELTEQTPMGYLLLFYQELKPEASSLPGSHFEVFNQLKSLIRQKVKAKELVFFLNQFDELEFMTQSLANNLKSLWQIDKPRIHFVFLPWDNISRPNLISQYGELAEVIMENAVKIPPLSSKDIDYVIARQAYFLKTKFNQSQVWAIKKISQGNPYLIKTAIRLLAQEKKVKNPNVFLAKHYQIRLVKEEGKKKRGSLNFDPQTGIISAGKIPLDINLTGKEYDLLTAFLTKKNQILSRDQIAEILWGKESYEKYSDWAIDQLIHQLRSKLVPTSAQSNLETIRGRGYRYQEK